MFPQRHQISNTFVPAALTMGGLHVLLNYPYSYVKKVICLKQVWMPHCTGADWDRGIKDFLKGEIKKEGNSLIGGEYPLQTMYALSLGRET